MAMTFVGRSQLAVTTKGKTAGAATVTVTGNGQIGLSSLALAALGDGVDKVVFGYDSATRMVGIYAFTTEVEKALGEGALEATFHFNKAKKGGKSSTFAATRFLAGEAFGGEKYDYKASGNQTFSASTDSASQCVTFTLPAGALAAKPKVSRPRKPKTVETTLAPQAPQAPVEEDLLIPA